MSFYKKVPGLQRTLESELLFDKVPTVGSTSPVTSEGVAEALNESETNTVQFVFDDGDTTAKSIDDITEEYYNSHVLGNFYIEEGKVYVCTKHEHSGDDYETKLEKVNGMVEALNKLAERVTALENA
jgi:hypothetical protein